MQTAEEYDYDWDSIALSAGALGAPGDDGYTSHMDVEQEESEEDDDMETEYGSLDLVNEDFSVFEELNPQEYDDYRFILLSESRGVEHYIVRKLAWLRSLPVTRDVWIGIQELFSMHKSIQLGGIETRKRAIDFLCARRRYHFWYDRGRVPPGESLEESDMPDEWIAAHYGWGEPTTFQPGEDAGEIASWSPSDAGSRAEGERGETEDRDDRPSPVVNDEATVSPSDGAAGPSSTPGTTTAAPAVTPKGKCGGKGRTVIYYLVLLMEIPAITGIKGRVLHMSALDITHAIAICSSVSITFTSEAFHGPSKTWELPCRVLLPCNIHILYIHIYIYL